MIKLHASYGLKVPAEQDYSSQSFHATAEIELADATSQDPESMRRALHKLWSELKQAVAAEIGNGSNSQVATTPENNTHTRHDGGNGNGRTHEPVNRIAGNGNSASATKKQIGFLLSLARRHKGMGADQTRKWLQTTHGVSLDDLSKAQAGQIIDTLQN